MNSRLEFFKQFIIKTADEYIQEFDVTERDIWVIDNYADYMLSSLQTLLEKGEQRNENQRRKN